MKKIKLIIIYIKLQQYIVHNKNKINFKIFKSEVKEEKMG